MQWFIDIIKDWVLSQAYATETWVQNQNYLQTSYVDRGDTLGYDFHKANFTLDNAWHDLDLSAIVPAGPCLVHFAMIIYINTTGHSILFRKKGHPWGTNRWGFVCQSAIGFVQTNPIVLCDADRKIQYKVTGVSCEDLELMVRGWWLQ